MCHSQHPTDWYQNRTPPPNEIARKNSCGSSVVKTFLTLIYGSNPTFFFIGSDREIERRRESHTCAVAAGCLSILTASISPRSSDNQTTLCSCTARILIHAVKQKCLQYPAVSHDIYSNNFTVKISRKRTKGTKKQNRI